MGDNFKATFAEFIGTFTLIFIGAGAGATAAAAGTGQLGVAWAHGLALMVIVYVWGSISGGTSIRRLRSARWWPAALVSSKPFCIGLRNAGAIAAAYLLKYLLPAEYGLGETIGLLTPTAGSVGDPIKVIVLEGVLTFFLVVSVFASGVQNRNGNVAGIAIGFVLAMDIIIGGNLTGASMNPARTLGPAVVAQHMDYLWMYIVGPLAGGGVAALLYDRLFTAPE